MGLMIALIISVSSGWAYAQQVEIEDVITIPLEETIFPIEEYRVPQACQAERAVGDTRSGEVLFNIMKLYRQATLRLAERDKTLIQFGIVDLELRVPMPATALATLRLTVCGWKLPQEEYRHIELDGLRPFLDLLHASLIVAQVKMLRRCNQCEDGMISPLSFAVALPERTAKFRYHAQWRVAAGGQR